MTSPRASLTLTIVRHGDTFAPGEAPRRIGAVTDLPLVASGEAQARALGRHFAREPFDRVLVSPLRRTRRTAELMLADHSPAQAGVRLTERIAGGDSGPPPARGNEAHMVIETVPWLAEIDHGPDENATEEAVVARIGAEVLARWNDALVAPPSWVVDADARLAAWRALFDAASGHLLLVTSAGAARFALAADRDLAEQAGALPSRKLRTGAWGRIAIADGKVRLEAWDRRPNVSDGD